MKQKKDKNSIEDFLQVYPSSLTKI